MPRTGQNKWRVKVILALFGMAIFAFSYQLGNRYANRGKATLVANILTRPVLLTQLHFIDKNGEPFNVDSFSPYWNVLIGGNHKLQACKDLVTAYVLAWNRLSHLPELQKSTRIVFYLLDPGNTPPGELKSFIDFYNPDFTAVSGDRPGVQYLAEQLGLPGKEDSDHIYCESQASVVGLVNPQGYLVATFTGSSEPRAIAHDLQILSN